jgi:hypothetical protein
MLAVGTVSGILAQMDRPFTKEEWFESVHLRFLHGEPELVRNVVLAVLTICLVLAVPLLLHRWQRRRQQPTPAQPMALYRRVLSKMGLTVIERWLLWRLARNSGMEHPTALLISSRLYDAAVDHYCAGDGLFVTRAGKAASYAAIRRRVFGEKSR